MCRILEISDHEWKTITSDQLKKKHRSAILKWHPDKNNGANGDKFIEVNESYKYLLSIKNDEYSLSPDKIDTAPYSTTAFNLANIYKLFNESPFYTLLLKFLTSIMENNTYMYLSKLDTDNLKKIYVVMEKYFPNTFVLDYIEKIMEEKTESYIILNPNIDDLLNDNIYKLKLDGETYIVPLWHHELIYDHCGNEIIIECWPVLHDNMEIDENNVLYVHCYYDIKDVFDKEKVEVEITPKYSVFFNGRDLKLTSAKQEVVVKNAGISSINETNIYDVTQRCDIVLYIYLL